MDRNDTVMDSAMPSQQDPGGVAIRDLLSFARQLINQGKPAQALQAIESLTTQLGKLYRVYGLWKKTTVMLSFALLLQCGGFQKNRL